MIVLMTQSFGEIKACLCVRMDAHLLPTYPEVVVILLLRLNIMCFKKNGMPLYLDLPLFDGKRVCPHTHNLASRFWAINVLFKPAFDFSRGLLFAVLSFSQRRWKNEKVFPASYSRLVLPTALYRSPLSCRRRIPAAVVSGPAPPRRRMRVSFGIFNANFGFDKCLCKCWGILRLTSFQLLWKHVYECPKSGCRPGVMQWVSAFILWLESCAESLLKSQTVWDALICANSTAGVSFSVWTFFSHCRIYASMWCKRFDAVHLCVLKCAVSKFLFWFNYSHEGALAEREKV